MPRYSIRRHYTYVDSFEVEAESLEAADRLVDEYERMAACPSSGYPAISPVVQTHVQEFNDYDSSWGAEIDAEGWELGDIQEL